MQSGNFLRNSQSSMASYCSFPWLTPIRAHALVDLSIPAVIAQVILAIPGQLLTEKISNLQAEQQLLDAQKNLMEEQLELMAKQQELEAATKPQP